MRSTRAPARYVSKVGPGILVTQKSTPLSIEPHIAVTTGSGTFSRPIANISLRARPGACFHDPVIRCTSPYALLRVRRRWNDEACWYEVIPSLPVTGGAHVDRHQHPQAVHRHAVEFVVERDPAYDRSDEDVIERAIHCRCRLAQRLRCQIEHLEGSPEATFGHERRDRPAGRSEEARSGRCRGHHPLRLIERVRRSVQNGFDDAPWSGQTSK